MIDNLKSAFYKIQAEETLKSNTLLYLRYKTQNHTKKKNTSVKKLVAVLSCFVVLLFTSLLSYNFYLTPNVYVDVDVNPSIELVVNRFDRIIGVHSYNQDGENLLLELELKHKNYNDALLILIETIEQMGYIEENGFVSVTLQTNNQNREDELLLKIKNSVESVVLRHNKPATVEVFSVSEETRNIAYENDISPKKYLTILELMEVDPATTIEGCKGHSVGELKQSIEEQKNNCYKDAESQIMNRNSHHGNGHG